MRISLNQRMPKQLWNIFLLFIMATTIAVCYGFQYKISEQDDSFFYYSSFSIIFVLAFVFLTYNFLTIRAESVHLSTLHGWIGLALMTFSLTLTLFFQSKAIGSVPWYVLAICIGFIGFLVHWKWMSRGSTYFFALVGFVLLVVFITGSEIWSQGDMLLAIEATSKEFLSGKQPYRLYPEIYAFLAEKQPYEVLDIDAFVDSYYSSRIPPYYLPGGWLIYTPAVALGIDPRIFTVIFLVCIVLVFERWLPIKQNKAIILSLTLYPILLSPSFLGIFKGLHVLHFWLFLLLTVLFIQKKKYWAAAVFFGLALATRQASLFLVLPLLTYLFLKVKWLDTLKYVLASLAVYLIIVLPFAIWWGQDFAFWKHTYLSFTSLSGEIRPIVHQIGLASLLDRVGLGGNSSLIQISLALITALTLVYKKDRDFSWTIQLLGIFYISVVLFNTYALRFIYYPGFLFLLVGMTVALGNSSNLPNTINRRPSLSDS